MDFLESLEPELPIYGSELKIDEWKSKSFYKTGVHRFDIYNLGDNYDNAHISPLNEYRFVFETDIERSDLSRISLLNYFSHDLISLQVLISLEKIEYDFDPKIYHNENMELVVEIPHLAAYLKSIFQVVLNDVDGAKIDITRKCRMETRMAKTKTYNRHLYVCTRNTNTWFFNYYAKQNVVLFDFNNDLINIEEVLMSDNTTVYNCRNALKSINILGNRIYYLALGDHYRNKFTNIRTAHNHKLKYNMYIINK